MGRTLTWSRWRRSISGASLATASWRRTISSGSAGWSSQSARAVLPGGEWTVPRSWAREARPKRLRSRAHRPFRVVRLGKGRDGQVDPVAGQPQQPLLVDPPQLPLPPLPLDDAGRGRGGPTGTRPARTPPPPTTAIPDGPAVPGSPPGRRRTPGTGRRAGARTGRRSRPGALLGGEGVAAVGVGRIYAHRFHTLPYYCPILYIIPGGGE